MGKVVLITGAQRGIGRAIALRCARAGHDVVVNHAEEGEAAESLVAELTAEGVRALAVQADIRDLAQIDAMMAAVRAEFGRLDVLVNNAGVFPRSNFLEITEAEWDFVLGVNLKGNCFTSIAAAKLMIAGGQSGSIIGLSSQAVDGSPRGAHYAASKGGIVSLTRTMALELAPHGIRVNAIAPGITNTIQPRFGLTEAEIAARGTQIPLGRIAEPEDIAGAALFLMSADAAMITGQVMHVNGGTYRP
jgi:NAD(P)-dependent dehydrogenase (short-subunit alcohol dehydrogenase family)